MQSLTQHDVASTLRHLPKDVIKMLKENRLYLGGGIIRAAIAGEAPSDIDIFGPSATGETDCMLQCAKSLVDSRQGARLYKTGNAFTVLTNGRLPVQFVNRWRYDTPEAVVNSFDFTIAMVMIYWHPESESWRSMCHDRFYQDMAAHRLVYTSPVRDEAAGGSLMRARKFLRRGYQIDAPSLASLIARIMSKVELERAEQLRDEPWITRLVEALLREVDPLSVVDKIEIDEYGDRADPVA